MELPNEKNIVKTPGKNESSVSMEHITNEGGGIEVERRYTDVFFVNESLCVLCFSNEYKYLVHKFSWYELVRYVSSFLHPCHLCSGPHKLLPLAS